MAITIGQNSYVKKINVEGQQTIVKKVVVGTPIRLVDRTIGLDLGDIDNVDTSAKVDGSVLVYNATTENWEATLDLDKQNINGGGF